MWTSGGKSSLLLHGSVVLVESLDHASLVLLNNVRAHLVVGLCDFGSVRDDGSSSEHEEHHS